jgi:hypothetical protein
MVFHVRSVAMRVLVTAVVVAAALACAAGGDLEQEIAVFVEATRVRRDVAATFDAAASALKLRKVAADRAEGVGLKMYLRRFAMPGGARAWITFRVEAPPKEVERALIAALGKVTGRGFGDEDGWLLPTGGLILERFEDRAHITFSPGPPENALEDLARPHLPDAIDPKSGLRPTFTNGGRRLVAVHGTAAAVSRAVGVTATGKEKCLATGNYFIVRQADGITVWRRPFAQWNVEVQRECATAAPPP